ncbi:alpha/beta hydrolase [Pseudonocardiaceae bacterium YIM PH 21723]|nr:alpha/beta hydrolase [Pseudonocardiaceae bacterium YIM PH 21723]
MSRLWRNVGVASGVVAAAVGGIAVGVGARGAVIGRQLRKAERNDPYADIGLGEIPADREYTVAADDGVPLAVEETLPAGGGTPDITVVLLHGWTLDQRMWHFQRFALSEMDSPKVRVLTYDHRSHGRSGRSRKSACTIEQLARDLDAVLRVMVPEGPIVLVGHSMGGMTIMSLAEQRPDLFDERIRGVALVNTSAGELGSYGLNGPILSPKNPLTQGIGRLARIQPDLVKLTRGLADDIEWGVIRGVAFGDKDVPLSLVNLMYEMINGCDVKAITDFMSTLNTHNRLAALPALARCQVSVIGGSADKLTPYEHSELMAAEIPEAELIEVSGAGHMVNLEAPDQVNEALAGLATRSVEEKRAGRRKWWKQA